MVCSMFAKSWKGKQSIVSGNRQTQRFQHTTPALDVIQILALFIALLIVREFPNSFTLKNYVQKIFKLRNASTETDKHNGQPLPNLINIKKYIYVNSWFLYQVWNIHNNYHKCVVFNAHIIDEVQYTEWHYFNKHTNNACPSRLEESNVRYTSRCIHYKPNYRKRTALLWFKNKFCGRYNDLIC